MGHSLSLNSTDVTLYLTILQSLFLEITLPFLPQKSSEDDLKWKAHRILQPFGGLGWRYHIRFVEPSDSQSGWPWKKSVFVSVDLALGSTPTSGRAVQQKVEGRFNHGVNFFDAFCHQDGVSLFVWTQQLHHTMTSCAQSTFIFVCNVMQCFAAWVCSCDGLCRTQIPRNSLFNSMPGTAGTAQPLDWTFTWNAIYAEQVWSWMHHESRSLALPACKLVLLWRTLRESIFHCLRHVLVSLIC